GKEGDIIDCVDINKQPALDHPLLKNHRVQVEPKLHFNRFERFSPNEKFVKFRWREPCPVGTVPISRVTKENLRRARSLPKMPSMAAVEHDAIASNQHVISLREDAIENIKYGCHGAVSVYNLTVAHDQFSSHNMWIETGPPDHISMIAAGWQGNGHRDGCYNVLCRGFIQIDRELSPGTPMRAASTYGRDVFALEIRIDQVRLLSKFLFFSLNQDRDTGNWWLHCDNPAINVGYWPKELFLYLRNGSLHTAWGGVSLAGSNGVCPPMGSGHKPDGDFRHATYFRTLKWVSATGDALPPSRKISEWVDKSNVYGFKNHHVVIRQMKGYTISFGGPGGYCGG
ncbi:hypothetical protein EUGRSUZ_K01485, partial [Eucalyptus grandis]